jgi:hypothetical protein
MANFMRLKRATALQTIEFLRNRHAADNAPRQ